MLCGEGCIAASLWLVVPPTPGGNEVVIVGGNFIACIGDSTMAMPPVWWVVMQHRLVNGMQTGGTPHTSRAPLQVVVS